MFEFIQNWLADQGLGEFSSLIAQCLILAGALVFSFIAHLIAKKFLLVRLENLVRKSRIKWDDTFFKKKVFNRILHFVPALVIYFFASALPDLEAWIQRPLLAYMILIGLLVLDSILSAGVAIYDTFEISIEKPIKSYVQIVKILLYVVGGILVFGTLMDRSPWGILTGLGAMTAILLLVFKDSILGLVAGFQFVSNKMVRIGDWIEMPKYGADGDVIDITLNTVKVQNWDKTISTIPTYALVSDSFKNWRGMEESEGRRIKRAIKIDINSIKFCTDEMLQRFERIHYLADYVRSRKKETAEFNKKHNIDPEDISGRRMTNIGTFRAYIVAYLRNHPRIHQEMTFLIRQLAPTEHGLPLEIYVFSADKRWVNYEGIQSDIFDHILAVVSEFDLRIFQNPGGYDFRAIAANEKKNKQ